MPEPIDPGMLEWLAALNGVSPQEYLDGQAQTQQTNAANNAREAQRRAGLAEYWKNNPPSTSNTGTEFLIENPRTPEEIARANEHVTNRLDGREYGSYADAADAYTSSANSIDASFDPARRAMREGAATDSAARASNVQGLGAAFQSATEGNRGLFQGMQGAASAANARDQGTISSLDAAYATNNARDDAALSGLRDRYGQYGQLQSQAYHENISSNPADVARQQASYDALGGWASGANDIYSDAGLVGQQQGVVDQFGNWASGANDVSSDAGLVGQQQDVYGGFLDYASGANAISSDAGLVGMQQGVYDDFGQFASGAMDLESEAATAQADAEALAAQKEALGEFRERMDPKQTDAERFMYMQSRLAQEQSQRAARDANYRELERRGMGGSTMALSNLNASSAEASNTRALQDLGANAKAVDRAEKALVNYGNMSSTIADQSFQRDFATKSAADKMAITNNQQRMAGIQGQGQMSTEMRRADDEMRQFNSTQQMQGLQGAGQMANTMRGQDDAMRNANADRRLAGTQGQGNMLNSMRQSDDAMRMGNRDARLQGTIQQGQMATDMRSANDAINMFNSEQTNIQARHRDDFAAGQQRDAWNRDTDMAGAEFRATENRDKRVDSRTGHALTASENQWGREADTARTGVQINRDFIEGYDNVVGRDNEARRDDAADRRGNAEFDLGTARLRAEGEGRAIETRQKQLDSDSEDRRAREAETAAQKRQADQQEFEGSFANKGVLGWLGIT